jgi:hypothetical protein
MHLLTDFKLKKVWEIAPHQKATWITKPEGFIMHAGEKMLYWDLSKFEVWDFLKQ